MIKWFSCALLTHHLSSIQLVSAAAAQAFVQVWLHGPRCVLHDVSLLPRLRARDEEVLAAQPQLRAALRRGLSFLEVEGSEPVLARRGLPKFFDADVSKLRESLAGELGQRAATSAAKVLSSIWTILRVASGFL